MCLLLKTVYPEPLVIFKLVYLFFYCLVIQILRFYKQIIFHTNENGLSCLMKNLLKDKFTKLSEYVKDIKLINLGKEIKKNEFNQISEKPDFSKKQNPAVKVPKNIPFILAVCKLYSEVPYLDLW